MRSPERNLSEHKLATRDTFLAARRKTVTIDLPDLELAVNVLKGSWSTVQAVKKLKEDQIAEQIALILADEEGNTMFTNPEDIEKIADILTLTDMKLILDKWQEINGIGEKAVNEITKNSEASQSVDSESVLLAS